LLIDGFSIAMTVRLDEAIGLLQHSCPVAIPTETVWGLAARWDDEEGIRKIFSLKGRPLNNPLIIHVADQRSVLSCVSNMSCGCFLSEHERETQVVRPPEGMAELMEAFWPGGLTLVVPVDERKVLPSVRAGLPTAAFRMPDQPETLELIARVGPLVAPSANRSGSPSATTPEHIYHDFGADFPVLTASSFCRHGVESTILIWDGAHWALGRRGAIREDDIASIIGYEPAFHTPLSGAPLCPGQLFRHYAPKAALTLSRNGWHECDAADYDGVLGFADRHYPKARCVVSMGLSDDPTSVSHRLYASLRELDDRSLRSVFVDFDIPLSYGWNVIIDRLERAAQKEQR
jgi:L-threonylcarbamoyladenylate synthase